MYLNAIIKRLTLVLNSSFDLFWNRVNSLLSCILTNSWTGIKTIGHAKAKKYTNQGIWESSNGPWEMDTAQKQNCKMTLKKKAPIQTLFLNGTNSIKEDVLWRKEGDIQAIKICKSEFNFDISIRHCKNLPRYQTNETNMKFWA